MADGDVLFGRRCKLTIAVPVKTPGDFSNVTTDVIEVNGTDDPAAPGLRIQFKITKTQAKEPNISEVTITNLSPTRRASLQVKGVKVTLDAGYAASGLSRLFKGDVRTIDHKRDGADWLSVLKCGDGERAYRFARVAESFAGGTSAADVLRWLGNASGLAIGNVPDVASGLIQAFDQGYAVFGRWSDEMNRLVSSLGYTWSVQDETLQVLLPGQALDASVPEISPESGLIGSPEMGTPEKKGKPALVKFKSLLRPVRIGGKVKLKSARYDGFVRVKKVEHVGDTEGSDWYSTIEGVIHGS